MEWPLSQAFVWGQTSPDHIHELPQIQIFKKLGDDTPQEVGKDHR